MIKRLNQKIKHHFLEVLELKTSTVSIAAGFAVGSLISILPTPGFGVVLGTVVVMLFKKVNKISTFIALAFWNPLTLAPIYALSFKIGYLIFGNEPIVEYKFTILEQVYHYTQRFLVGNIISAICISALCYFMSYVAVEAFKRKKNSKEVTLVQTDFREKQ